MPISRNEFDAGERKLDLALLAILRSSPELAFTLSDLIEELAASSGLFVLEDAALAALNELEGRDRVESKVIADAVYYSYKNRFGFRP